MIPLSQTPEKATINPTGGAGAANASTFLPHPLALFIDRVRAIALRAPSPLASGARKRSPSFGRVSTIAGDALVIAILFACLAIPAVFAGA